MKGEPGEDELVAIVAAYVMVMREGRRLAAVPTPVPAWRTAAKVDLDDAAAARTAARRSAWRTVTLP